MQYSRFALVIINTGRRAFYKRSPDLCAGAACRLPIWLGERPSDTRIASAHGHCRMRLCFVQRIHKLASRQEREAERCIGVHLLVLNLILELSSTVGRRLGEGPIPAATPDFRPEPDYLLLSPRRYWAFDSGTIIMRLGRISLVLLFAFAGRN